METLMDLYKSVQSPLDDLDNVKKMIEIYSKFGERNFYKGLVQETMKKSDGYRDTKSINKLTSILFNTWKNTIVQMSEEEYQDFYSQKGTYRDNDFQSLKKYLGTIRDVSTEDEVETIMNKMKNNPMLANILKKYTYEVKQGTGLSTWHYVDSEKLCQKHTNFSTHRLYINAGELEKESIVLLFLQEAVKNDMEYTLKYDEAGARGDTIVIYANDENVLQYINILRNLREKYDIFKSSIYPPPVMDGTIDGWLGYGSEPTITIDKKQQSYTTFREMIVCKAIKKIYSDWIATHSNIKGLSEFEIAEKDTGFIQAVRDEIRKIGKEYKIDENNFCFDTKTVQQMMQTDSKYKSSIEHPIKSTPTDEDSFIETIALADELLQKPGIDWEDLLENENDEKRKAQKQRAIKKKVDRRDKDYYKNAEAYLRKSIQTSAPKSSKEDDETRDLEACLRELQRLTPEERNRGNQYLSALEQEQNLEK